MLYIHLCFLTVTHILSPKRYIIYLEHTVENSANILKGGVSLKIIEIALKAVAALITAALTVIRAIRLFGKLAESQA